MFDYVFCNYSRVKNDKFAVKVKGREWEEEGGRGETSEIPLIFFLQFYDNLQF